MGPLSDVVSNEFLGNGFGVISESQNSVFYWSLFLNACSFLNDCVHYPSSANKTIATCSCHKGIKTLPKVKGSVMDTCVRKINMRSKHIGHPLAPGPDFFFNNLPYILRIHPQRSETENRMGSHSAFRARSPCFSATF